MALHKAKVADRFSFGLAPGNAKQTALVKSIWEVSCIRDGKELWQEIKENVVTNEGLNALLNVMFSGSTQLSTWFVALTEAGTAGTNSTYASPTYTECTSYDEVTRPAFTASTAGTAGTSLALISNAHAKAEFTISASKTLLGGALLGGAAGTKGDTGAGKVLYCSSLFSTSRAVVDDDVILIQITLTAVDS